MTAIVRSTNLLRSHPLSSFTQIQVGRTPGNNLQTVVPRSFPIFADFVAVIHGEHRTGAPSAPVIWVVVEVPSTSLNSRTNPSLHQE